MIGLILALTVSPRVHRGEDWNQFRGPQSNGIVSHKNEKLPLTWDEGKGIRWFTKLPGLGWSSPVVVGHRVYVTTAVAEGDNDKALEGPQSLRLLALDANSGSLLFDREIFKQPTDAPSVHGKNSHASPTPVYDGQYLFVHFGHQGTAAFDLEGNAIWSNRDHTFAPTHGNGGSPILVEDKLIVTCDGGDAPHTLALDRRTGKEIWRTPRSADADRKFSFCTPSYFVVNGRPQIVSPGSNIVQSLDPTTGQVLWSVAYDGYSVIPKPILHQGLVFVCTGYGPTTIYAIDPTGNGDVTESHVRWKVQSTNVPKTPSLLAFEKIVLMCSDRGIATGLDALTGKELWKLRLGGDYSASPLLNGNLLYFQAEQGDVAVYEIEDDGTQSPLERGKSMLPGRTFASYAVVDNDFLIRAEAGLYRIGQD